MRQSILSITAAVILFPHSAIAQCSDAGVCAIGGKHSSTKHTIGASYVFGRSGKTDDLTFHSIHFEGSFQVLADSRITLLLPWMNVNGPLGSISGIGDVTFVWKQKLWDAGDKQLSGQLGGKLATGNDNGGGLPQAYQSGLGTNDILVGLAFESDPWVFAVAYQRAGGRNKNAISRLDRGDDLLVRMGYRTQLSDVQTRVEILAIKRLGESSILNPASTTSFLAIPGSDQFQINILPSVSLPISETTTLQGFAAIPIRSRPVNVDGLTRSLTLSIGLVSSL